MWRATRNPKHNHVDTLRLVAGAHTKNYAHERTYPLHLSPQSMRVTQTVINMHSWNTEDETYSSGRYCYTLGKTTHMNNAEKLEDQPVILPMLMSLA